MDGLEAYLWFRFFAQHVASLSKTFTSVQLYSLVQRHTSKATSALPITWNTIYLLVLRLQGAWKTSARIEMTIIDRWIYCKFLFTKHGQSRLFTFWLSGRAGNESIWFDIPMPHTFSFSPILLSQSYGNLKFFLDEDIVDNILDKHNF